VRTRTALIGTLLLAGVLAGCGDDEPETAAVADDPSTETTAAPADEMGGPAAAEGDTVTVEIGDFQYDPTPVEVTVGQSVVWENVHTQAHTSTGTGDQRWDTQNIAPGESSEPVVFEDAGTYTYICALHPFMEGTVEVSA
jgi:plastocyanin